MTEANELLARAWSLGFQDHGAASLAEQAAALWRDNDQAFSAGHAMALANRLGWNDQVKAHGYRLAAVRDFQLAATNAVDGLRRAAALHKLPRALVEIIRSSPSRELRDEHRRIVVELADGLVSDFGNTADAEAYLTRGMTVWTNLDGEWAGQTLRDQAVGVEGLGAGSLWFGLPSAFDSYMATGNYTAAARIADAYPASFDTPGRRGWSHRPSRIPCHARRGH